jgi:hypothetical protein
VEMITSMGAMSRFWEKAGFIDHGPMLFAKKRKSQNEIYGTMYNRKGTSAEATSQSKLGTMHYYLAEPNKLKTCNR